MSGWLPVKRDFLSAQNPLHPMLAGEKACRAFARLDIAGMARFAPGDGMQIGEAKLSERFLAKRWNWSKGRVHRFLQELETGGFIELVPGNGREQRVYRLLTYASDFMLPEDAAQRANHKRDHEADHQRDRSNTGAETESEEGGTAGSAAEWTANGTKEGDRERGQEKENTSAVGLFDERPTRVRVYELMVAMGQGPEFLQHAAGVQGFGTDDAEWIIRGLVSCELLVAHDENTHLAASVLDDLRRKSRGYTRKIFLSFMAAAIQVRRRGDDASVELMREAFGDGVPHPVERALTGESS